MTTSENASVEDILIAALASGLSYQEAGEAARCSKSTVARRMGDSVFRAQVADARAEYVHMLRGRLLQSQPLAVAVLSDLMMTATSQSDRIRAARTLLEAQKRDPFLDVHDLNRLTERLVDAAMANIPEEHQARFIAQVRAIR